MAKEPFLFGGSRDLRGTDLRCEPEELGAVVRLVVFEHAEDGVQELAHDGDESLHFGLAASDQEFIKSAQMGIMSRQAGTRAGM